MTGFFVSDILSNQNFKNDDVSVKLFLIWYATSHLGFRMYVFIASGRLAIQGSGKDFGKSMHLQLDLFRKLRLCLNCNKSSN